MDVLDAPSRLASRLLDWTESPLVGLFFAVDGLKADPSKEDGALWCLLPNLLNKWSIDWPEDTQALPMLSEHLDEYPEVENESVANYLPSHLGRTSTSRMPIAGINARTTRRIQAQLGVFTVHHLDRAPLDQAGDQSHIWRFRIPADRKAHLREELKRIGVTRRMIFPELDSVAADVTDFWGAL